MKTTHLGTELLGIITRRHPLEAELLNKDLELLPDSHGGVLTEDGAIACFQPDKKDGTAPTLAISAAFVRFIFKNRSLRIQVIQEKVEENAFWFRAT